MLRRATVGECSLSGLQFRVGQVSVGRFGTLSGKQLCRGVGQAARVSGKQLCRVYMVCVALERKHVENMQKPFCSESMPVGQLSICRGRNAVGAYSSLSGFARCRVCRGKVAVGPAFQTLSGMIPCRGPCRESRAVGLLWVRRPAQPTTSELVGINSYQEGTKPCLRPKTSP